MAKLNAQRQKERDALVQRMTDMKNNGKTYREIGEVFGVSRQRVCQMIGRGDTRFFRHVSAKSCVYKGVRKYLNDNKISIAELVRMVYGAYHPRNFYTMRNRLSGATDMPKSYIDKILEITGLAYEVAFEVESEV